MTVIEIKPHRWGWKAFESSGVEPVFPNKDQAIDYAQTRACFRSGEIQILKSNSAVERIIPFDESDRRLYRQNAGFLRIRLIRTTSFALDYRHPTREYRFGGHFHVNPNGYRG
jgi:hypothetical protein